MTNIRLYYDNVLECGINITLYDDDYHYICRVMRVNTDNIIKVFNHKYGEWNARIISHTKNKCCVLALGEQIAEPVHTIFGPIVIFSPGRKGLSSFIAQKATELGAIAIIPTIMDRSVSNSINITKLRLIAKEATEQSGRIDIPLVYDACYIDDLPEHCQALNCNTIIVADPTSSANYAILHTLAAKQNYGIVIGPEGGMTDKELNILASKFKNIYKIKLGPRILRMETAIIAILSVYQITVGDWA